MTRMEMLLTTFQLHFERIWKGRHGSELARQALKDNLRGQRKIREDIKKGH